MAMAMVAQAMATVTRMVGKQQRGQWWQQQLWQVTMRGIAMAMRVARASNKEGEGGKVIVMVTRVAGKQRQRQGRGQW
jgi:hypothetical protein